MSTPNVLIYSSVKYPQHPMLYTTFQRGNHYKLDGDGVHLSALTLKFSSKQLWLSHEKYNTSIGSRRFSLVCQSTDTHNVETKERVGHYGDCSNISSSQNGDEFPNEIAKNISTSFGLAEACKYVTSDAKFVNERAKNVIVLLSRGIMKLDARARQDIAFLGSEFLKLDGKKSLKGYHDLLYDSSLKSLPSFVCLLERAREDTLKVDRDLRKKAERFHHVATILKKIVQTRLKSAADKHWCDGALEADLKRVCFAAKRRAMEDSLMTLEFVKNIHDMMVSKMYRSIKDNSNEVSSHMPLEKNGSFFPGEVSTDHINVIQEVYRSIASALSEVDGVDYTDPEELELLVAALIDLDAMDGKSSVSLLAECSSSPDVSTRRALANALSAAPSMWTLGNAGMGALQRLSEDSNPAIAEAAAKTINELKKQWEIDQNSLIMSEDEDEEDTGGAD